MPSVTVIGAGLAGCEVAWQLAERGHRRAARRAEAARAHPRADDRRVLRARVLELVARRRARQRRRPAQGRAAARRLAHPALRRRDARACRRRARRRSRRLLGAGHGAPSRATPGSRWRRASSRRSRRRRRHRPVVLATGPLTGDALAADLARVVGSDAPRVLRRDRAHRRAPTRSTGSRVFKQSRYGKGAEDGADEAYVNCPLDEAQYRAFVADVIGAARRSSRGASRTCKYFEGCLPDRGHGLARDR